MLKYRKLPVEIEARQFDGTVESANRILGWIGSNGGDAKRVNATKPELGLVIHTLEGEMRAEPGDWIIKGVAGEFYPCRDDIFRQTYELVQSETPAKPGGSQKLWVVAQVKSFTPEGWAQDWDLGGVFSTEEKARAACTEPGDAVWSVTLDEDLGRETVEPPCLAYPLAPEVTEQP